MSPLLSLFLLLSLSLGSFALSFSVPAAAEECMVLKAVKVSANIGLRFQVTEGGFMDIDVMVSLSLSSACLCSLFHCVRMNTDYVIRSMTRVGIWCTKMRRKGKERSPFEHKQRANTNFVFRIAFRRSHRKWSHSHYTQEPLTLLQRKVLRESVSSSFFVSLIFSPPQSISLPLRMLFWSWKTKSIHSEKKSTSFTSKKRNIDQVEEFFLFSCFFLTSVSFSNWRHFRKSHIRHHFRRSLSYLLYISLILNVTIGIALIAVNVWQIYTLRRFFEVKRPI